MFFPKDPRTRSFLIYLQRRDKEYPVIITAAAYRELKKGEGP
jgi:hypothetical protein